ncbi:hypothetical protein [Devosia sp.]|uniref:hypothetical protein n=1 Tax=Devosia sp. TaxID=1871048 RepID=UPI003F6F483A
MTGVPDHAELVVGLRQAALDFPALTSPQLRQGAALRAAGGPAIDAPYDVLAKQIGDAAYRVTDAQVASVLAAAGSEKATFEIIAAAAVGAGLQRWEVGTRALEEAIDASR